MKAISRLMVFLFCLILSVTLWGCGTEDPQSSVTVPTLSQDAYLSQLEKAFSRLESAEHLLQTISLSERKTVSGQTYTHTAEQSLAFQNIGTRKMKAYLEKAVTYGSYQTTVTEFFTGGQPYLSISGRTFLGSEKADAFLKKQVPAVLFNPAGFSEMEVSVTESCVTLTFSKASAPEAWVTRETVTLLHASGTAKLDHAGNLLETVYELRYTAGQVEQELLVRSSASIPEQLDLSARIPPLPESPVRLACLDAPYWIMGAVGNVLRADTLSVKSMETVKSEATVTTRTQDIRILSIGRDTDYTAWADYLVQLTDYTGTTVSTLESIRFANGRCTTSTNGGEAIPLSRTAEEVRTQCEDVFLMSMFAISFLEQADLAETADTIELSFTGTQAMCDRILHSIYALLGVNLDTQASAVSTDPVTGYLTIDKHTGLPIASGMALSRTHTIHGVPYRLDYRLEQSFFLPGVS